MISDSCHTTLRQKGDAPRGTGTLEGDEGDQQARNTRYDLLGIGSHPATSWHHSWSWLSMLSVRHRDTFLSHSDSNWRRGDDCSVSYPPLHTTLLFSLLKKTNPEMPSPEEQQETWEREANDNCSRDEVNQV